MVKQVVKATKPAPTLAAALAVVPAVQAPAASLPLNSGARSAQAVLLAGMAPKGIALTPTTAVGGKRQKVLYYWGHYPMANATVTVVNPGGLTPQQLQYHSMLLAAMGGATRMVGNNLHAAVCAKHGKAAGGRACRRAGRAGIVVIV